MRNASFLRDGSHLARVCFAMRASAVMPIGVVEYVGTTTDGVGQRIELELDLHSPSKDS